jgi:hypothetical protein
VEKEVSGKMQSRSRIIAAAVMALIAITTIAYAEISVGGIGINPGEINISYPSINIYVPKGGVKSDSGTITIRFPSNFARMNVRFRAEIIVDEALYRDLLALNVLIKDGDTSEVKARLTLSQPWDEFNIQVPASSSPYEKSLTVVVIAVAGPNAASGTVDLRIVPVGIS